MNISLTIKLAWKNIMGNRLRSGLTILGLVIGIASVILLVGIVNGATESINDEMSSLGSDMITANIYSDDESGLTFDELSAVGKLEYISGVTAVTSLDGSVSRNGKRASGVALYGAGANYAQIMGYELVSGRDIYKTDVDNYTKCVLIGSKVAKKLWSGKEPYGNIININGDEYTVIGVISISGVTMSDVENSVVMPISTGSYLGGGSSVNQFYVKAESDDLVKEATTSIENYFSDTKGWKADDDYYVESQQSLQESMAEINKTMALLLGGIASISLIVGGIGVMNVMLVSVVERTREIGIRKSLGARRKDILIQFLIESVVLSMMGGLVGVVTGLLLGRVAIIVGAYFSPSLGIILLSMGVSMFVGLVFGIMPAYRASGLRPVEALRYE